MNQTAFCLKATALRSLLGGMLLGTVAVLSLAPSAAQDFGGQNTDAPVLVSADRVEVLARQDRSVMSGNVVITQGDLTLRSARTVLAFSTGDQGVKIHRLDALGGVNINRGNQSASAELAVYYFDRRIITMIGGVILRRGGDVLNGARLTIDLDSGISTLDGRGNGTAAKDLPSSSGTTGGRITGTFSVPKKRP